MLCTLPTVTLDALARRYRRFGEVDAASSSLYRRVALALAGSGDALRAIAGAPADRRHPALVLAALHDLALAGRAPALAAAYAAAAGSADGAATAAVDTLLADTAGVLDIVGRRRTRDVETARCAVLYPAVTEAARRAGAGAIGLVEVGDTAGLTLYLDRVGITYDGGPSLGDPSSPVQVSSSLRGGRAVPARAVPPVVARIGVDPAPLDLTDVDDARWLRACVWPDQPDRRAHLDAALAVVADAVPRLVRGDPVETLPDAVAAVPDDALPVVVTTWRLSELTLAGRLLLRQRLDDVAARRAVAWVSVEGVGVAPGIPTLGDRHASGHSIVGVTVLDGPSVITEVVGRCWSRGRWSSWLAARAGDPPRGR